MESFLTDKHLADFYRQQAETSQRPIMSITTNYEGMRRYSARPLLPSDYKGGGTPVLIPPVADRNVLLDTLETIDALLLLGGGDSIRCGLMKMAACAA